MEIIKRQGWRWIIQNKRKGGGNVNKNIKEVKELDMDKKEDIETLAKLLKTKKWIFVNSYYKNTNLKPPVFVMGRIIQNGVRKEWDYEN